MYVYMYARVDMCVYVFRTIAVIKPDAMQHMGKIIHEVYQNGFIIRCVSLKHHRRPYFVVVTSFAFAYWLPQTCFTVCLLTYVLYK